MKKQTGPWGEVQNALSARDRQIEIDSLLKSGMIDAPTAAALQDRTVTPTEQLSENPEFLDKVFPKKGKKK